MGREPQTEREDKTAKDHDESTQDWNKAVEDDRKGRQMDADKVIEWITHAMAIELTTHQEIMIRLHCDGGDMSYRSYARGGYKFAEVMVRAYREAEEKSMEHDEMPAVRSMVDAFDVLKYFAWEHLPAHLQEASKPFYMVALDVAERWVDGADEDETNKALRKLLEAKDAAVRAVVQVGYRPGGLVIRTSLHDHGGACDIESDEAWMKFTEAVQKAVEEFLPGEFTWVGHVDCQCASCEEEEEEEHV